MKQFAGLLSGHNGKGAIKDGEANNFSTCSVWSMGFAFWREPVAREELSGCVVAICGQQQALLSGDRRSRTDLVALDSQLIVTSSPAAKGTAVTTVIASSAGTNRVRESEWVSWLSMSAPRGESTRGEGEIHHPNNQRVPQPGNSKTEGQVRAANLKNHRLQSASHSAMKRPRICVVATTNIRDRRLW